ncbi:hypothetical protein G4B88_009437 [Cannabis sativa]|uniref:BAG domain-containing protein n=1 Tax=Cannabis sativa TaxID=3483 RepID=A0A7J6F4S9_CANSA|nr:hypothetical protein G4B88_009437 [Cannabis sativa]
MSKIILLKDPDSKEKKFQELKKNEGLLKAYEIAEVDKLTQKWYKTLTEMLMMQLLKLDTTQADGEARAQDPAAI